MADAEFELGGSELAAIVAGLTAPCPCFLVLCQDGDRLLLDVELSGDVVATTFDLGDSTPGEAEATRQSLAVELAKLGFEPYRNDRDWQCFLANEEKEVGDADG